jgi:hypothetical protein
VSSLTLTTWKCERCGLEVVTDSADTAPERWSWMESEDIVGRTRQSDLCDDCHVALCLFLTNEAVVEPQVRP